MKLSNYAHWIEIMDGKYALFNSILMQIAFVDKEQLVKIKKIDVNNKEKEQLLELGIYVKDDSILDEVDLCQVFRHIFLKDVIDRI